MMNWYFASGDMVFFWREQIEALSWLPNVFRQDQGFGFSNLLSLWLDYPFRVVVKLLSTLGLSWFFIEKLLWTSVFLLAVYSSYRLATHVLGKSPFTYLSSLIYATNTYILLLFSGGQLGVALAYALSPLVLFRFVKYQKTDVRQQITNGLWFALLVAFDLRLACLMLGVIVLWGIRSFVPFLVAASVHLFWILPTVPASRGTASLGEQLTNPGMLKFLSFADYPHALSLLHPNWPENLFGKVYFLQPEFLLVPIIAFSALLFREQKIRFFALLALVGAFFAKGVQEPLGGIFQWMFTYIPGFVMFRDPTKFYVLTAIGYSVLIPFALKRMNKKILSICFILFWIFTIRAINVRPVQLPREYVQLKNMLVSDTIPSRTLWIPQKENFAYFSDIHPILISTATASIDSSVKYIIVPTDVSKRIFLNDYKFDGTMRTKLIDELELKVHRNPSFHDLAVFENPDFTQMRGAVPAIAVKQQQLANVGLLASIVSLVGWIIARKIL